MVIGTAYKGREGGGRDEEGRKPLNQFVSFFSAPSVPRVSVPGFEAVDEPNWLYRMGSDPTFLGLRADSPAEALLDGSWNTYVEPHDGTISI